MTKALNYALAIGLALAGIGVQPQPARAGSAEELAQLCRTSGASAGFQSVGECMSLNRTNPNALASMICNAMAARGGIQFYGWKTVGECVIAFRAQFPA